MTPMFEGRRQFHFNITAPGVTAPWRVSAAMMRHEDWKREPVRHGDRLRFFLVRNGHSTNLGTGTCKSALPASVWRSAGGKLHCAVDGIPLVDREVEWLARDAGHASAADYLGYFDRVYHPFFNGVLLRW